MTGTTADIDNGPSGQLNMSGKLISRIYGQAAVEGRWLRLLAQEKPEQAD
jgi:hypothetical protein